MMKIPVYLPKDSQLLVPLWEQLLIKALGVIPLSVFWT